MIPLKCCFEIYTASDVNFFNHPAIIEEWEANKDKVDYEHNLHKGVIKHYLNME